MSHSKGNRKFYSANPSHPLYSIICKLVLQIILINYVLEEIIGKIKNIQKVFILGDMPEKGSDKSLKLLFVGNHLDKHALQELIANACLELDCNIKYITKIVSETEVYLKKNKEINKLTIHVINPIQFSKEFLMSGRDTTS